MKKTCDTCRHNEFKYDHEPCNTCKTITVNTNWQEPDLCINCKHKYSKEHDKACQWCNKYGNVQSSFVQRETVILSKESYESLLERSQKLQSLINCINEFL